MPFHKRKHTAKTKADRLAEREQRNDSSDSSEEEVFQVESILKKRTEGDLEFYLVKWKNYPETQATWQPKDNMTNCPNIIIEFELAQLPQQAKEDIASAETEEPFKMPSEPLPPSIYEHNFNALQHSTISSCQSQIAFLKKKMEEEAKLPANAELEQILDCQRDREGDIWLGVLLRDGQARRVRKEEVAKTNRLKIVEYYERLIQWSE